MPLTHLGTILGILGYIVTPILGGYLSALLGLGTGIAVDLTLIFIAININKN